MIPEFKTLEAFFEWFEPLRRHIQLREVGSNKPVEVHERTIHTAWGGCSVRYAVLEPVRDKNHNRVWVDKKVAPKNLKTAVYVAETT